MPHIELHSCHPLPPSTPSCPRPLSTPLSLPCLVRVLLETHSRCTLHQQFSVFGRQYIDRFQSCFPFWATHNPLVPNFGGGYGRPPRTPHLGGIWAPYEMHTRDGHSRVLLFVRHFFIFFFPSFFLSFFAYVFCFFFWPFRSHFSRNRERKWREEDKSQLVALSFFVIIFFQCQTMQGPETVHHIEPCVSTIFTIFCTLGRHHPPTGTTCANPRK
mmetsp:Transcript_70428/g.114435  ORF Transcript_70428/g.114435 Transcript_70428/m.114435 type:complete len:215 (-) Transcript_70428:667-1311(-)